MQIIDYILIFFRKIELTNRDEALITMLRGIELLNRSMVFWGSFVGSTFDFVRTADPAKPLIFFPESPSYLGAS